MKALVRKLALAAKSSNRLTAGGAEHPSRSLAVTFCFGDLLRNCKPLSR